MSPRDRTAQKAAYRAENREKIREYQRAYRAAHPEQRQAEGRRYYERNAEEIREKVKRWAIENPEKYAAGLARKRKPKVELTAEALALQTEDRARRRALARKKYRGANLAAHAAHEQNRRAQKRATPGKLPRGVVGLKRAAQGGLCVYCKTPLDKGAHLDHRVPLALGGANTEDNVQLLCPTCNCRKNAIHPDVFERRIGFQFAGAEV